MTHHIANGLTLLIRQLGTVALRVVDSITDACRTAIDQEIAVKGNLGRRW